MRVAVTGAAGLVGRTLVQRWRDAGADVTAWTRADVDVTDADAVRRVVAAAAPEVVVHAAAYTAVDRAESEPALAERVNAGGAANVARACADAGARCVYLSTDYVVAGEPGVPVPVEAPLRPLGAYARGKAGGETAVRALPAGTWLIARTAWVYGPGGGNFVDTMRTAAAARRAVRVVDDQHGAPTSTGLVADVLWPLVVRAASGVWHIVAAGQTTWFDVARAVYAAAGADPGLVAPCATAEAGRPAPRPRWSVLDSRATAAALGAPLPDWRDHVDAYVRTGVMPRVSYADKGVAQ